MALHQLGLPLLETVVGSHRDAAVIGPALRGVNALYRIRAVAASLLPKGS